MVRPRAPKASSSSAQPWHPGNITLVNHGSATPGQSEASSLTNLSRDNPARALPRWEVKWHSKAKKSQSQAIFTHVLGTIFYKVPGTGRLLTTPEGSGWRAIQDPDSGAHYFWNTINNQCSWEFNGEMEATALTQETIFESQPPPPPPERVNKVNGNICLRREVYLWAHSPGRQCLLL